MSKIVNVNSVDSAKGLMQMNSKNDKADAVNEESILFSGIINGQMNINEVRSDADKFRTDKLITTPVSGASKPFDLYKHQNGTGIKAMNASNEKIDKTKNEISDFQEQVVKEVAQDLNVSEEDVKNAMEQMGITAIDLLQPQNLVNLVLQIIPSDSQIDLVSNPAFSEMLSNIQGFGQQLLANLNMTATQLQQLNIEPLTTGDEFVEGLSEKSMEIESAQAIDVQVLSNQILEGIELQETNVIQNQDDSSEKVQLEEMQNQVEIEIVDHTSSSNIIESKTMNNAHEENNSSQYDDNLNGQEQMISQQMTNALPQNFEYAEPVSFVSEVQTTEIIEQIVERMQLNLNVDNTTLEMQLNPENLGKIYLEISQKEGAIHAKIAAANEAVKEALQLQMSTLQDKLENTGVKVEAIEITVATHEFERNLEQGNNPEQREQNEEKHFSFGRKNIDLNDMDQLASVMSEEEMLVAQIMKDNGNRVDLMA